MAFYLLERDRDGAALLAQALQTSLDGVRRCGRCRMFAEAELCPVCAAPARDPALLCVVESPSDVIAIEDSGSFRGTYFVLHGRLSPLDGIGPGEIGLDLLDARLADDQLREIILATSATVEGEATAAYVAGLARRHGRRTTRIAQGVPMGGELEFVDSGTLSRAIAGRTQLDPVRF
jgi:recombination protein RecR